MNSEFRHLLLEFCPSCSPEQAARLEAHCELLLRWNEKVNLTGVTRIPDVVRKHYAESIFLAGLLPGGVLRVADIGSGGGFPGIPIAVMRPELQVTLIESRRKKAAFLREASRGMSSVRVLTARAEQVRESFDWLVSRAVRAEDVLRLIPRLAPRVALLGSTRCPSGGSAILWEAPIALPWKKDNFVFIGRHVPRGT